MVGRSVAAAGCVGITTGCSGVTTGRLRGRETRCAGASSAAAPTGSFGAARTSTGAGGETSAGSWGADAAGAAGPDGAAAGRAGAAGPGRVLLTATTPAPDAALDSLWAGATAGTSAAGSGAISGSDGSGAESTSTGRLASSTWGVGGCAAVGTGRGIETEGVAVAPPISRRKVTRLGRGVGVGGR
jgi:hypothetical protein